MSNKLKIVRELLVQCINNIDSGNCNDDEESLNSAIESLSILNKGIPRISKIEACEKILKCSPRTFENYVALGIIPKAHKVGHFKELCWTEKDFDKAKEYRKLNK